MLLHGWIGEGKTATALASADLLRGEGFRVLGVLSHRVVAGGAVKGYDLHDLGTGATAPLVRLREEAGEGWESHGNPLYAFSAAGMEAGNRWLRDAAARLGLRTVVFADEYGGLEERGLGLYMGITAVADALHRGGAAVVTVRTSRVPDAERLLSPRAERAVVIHAGSPEAVAREIMDRS